MAKFGTSFVAPDRTSHQKKESSDEINKEEEKISEQVSKSSKGNVSLLS